MNAYVTKLWLDRLSYKLLALLHTNCQLTVDLYFIAYTLSLTWEFSKMYVGWVLNLYGRNLTQAVKNQWVAVGFNIIALFSYRNLGYQSHTLPT